MAPVPPLLFAVRVAVLPAHTDAWLAVAVSVKAGGCVMVKVLLLVQSLASFTVTV